MKPNRNRFKPTGFGSVWFFRTKLVQTSLAWFFCLIFSGLAWVFFVWVWFGSVFLISDLKNQNQTSQFFKILIDFFSWFGFLSYFFSDFLSLIGFSTFLSPLPLVKT
jgi:hypothetical protein